MLHLLGGEAIYLYKLFGIFLPERFVSSIYLFISVRAHIHNIYVTLWVIIQYTLFISPGKNTGVGCHSLFQGIFLTQGSKQLNHGFVCCRQILYHMSNQGGPLKLLQCLLFFLTLLYLLVLLQDTLGSSCLFPASVPSSVQFSRSVVSDFATP